MRGQGNTWVGNIKLRDFTYGPTMRGNDDGVIENFAARNNTNINGKKQVELRVGSAENEDLLVQYANIKKRKRVCIF